MKLAFCLYKYFPFGGLQRDFIRIAQICRGRGHQVTTYCLKWEGEQPDWLDVKVAPVKALTNPRRYRKFSRWFEEQLQERPADVVMGLTRCPGWMCTIRPTLVMSTSRSI